MTELPPMAEIDELTPVAEPTPQIPTPVPVPQKPAGLTIKKVFLIALGIIVGLVIIGVIYRSTRPKQVMPSPSPSPSVEPSPSITTGTKDLRLASLSIPYPDNWLVLFSPIVDAKTPNITPIYIVRSEAEYRENALCASTGSCTTTPLVINFSTKTQIWTGYSLADYLRTTDPDFPVAKLAETTYAERAGLGGYTDLSELTYQAVIRTGDTSYQTLSLIGQEDSRDMLHTLVESLNRVKTIEIEQKSASDLANKYTYTLKLSARLSTGEYGILDLILNNLLEPADPTASPSYILYTETAQPPVNYLDYTYYLLTDNPELNTGSYNSSQVSLTLTAPPHEDFAPYLEDPKYCASSTDCVYRANYCTFDAHNRYHLFRPPWGCEGVEYAGIGDSLSLEESLDCRRDETIDITYDSLECVANQCVAHNPVPVCKTN